MRLWLPDSHDNKNDNNNFVEPFGDTKFSKF